MVEAARGSVDQEVIVRDRDVKHHEPDDQDGVQDASNDSFPASDPPSWMGMRIGGPPRVPVTPEPVSRQDDRPATMERFERAESSRLM